MTALVWLLRRVVLAPAMIALTLLILVTVPVWIFVAIVLSPLAPGRLRPLRLLSIGLMHLILESLMLVVMFGLWVVSGFGWKLRDPWFERMHYRLVRFYLVVFFREARRVLRVQIVIEGPSPDAFPGKPVIVACRHAGPGDSFVLMYALMDWFGREPRVVLKDTMAWDPAIGIVLNRLPAKFVSPNPPRHAGGGKGSNLDEEVGRLAEGLDEDDAFVIFPEGGNFTTDRRERSIARLRKLGLEKMADRAAEMTNVLAPRPGGFLAALDAAPDADVLLVAHTGLDHLVTIADLWRELPMDKQLIMRWWKVERADIPVGREARIDWLYEWWAEVDHWIDEHRPVDVPAGRVTPRG